VVAKSPDADATPLSGTQPIVKPGGDCSNGAAMASAPFRWLPASMNWLSVGWNQARKAALGPSLATAAANSRSACRAASSVACAFSALDLHIDANRGA
jgi:hypothetical protein